MKRNRWKREKPSMRDFVLYSYYCGLEAEEKESMREDVLVQKKKLSLWNHKASRTEKISWKELLVRLELVLSTKGNLYVYYVQNDRGEIIHTSLVVGKCGKFPFLKEYEFEIGPCQTRQSERGRGIYPYVLSQIIADKCDRSQYYIFAEKSNIASIKGIEKTRFKECGTVSKCQGLRRRYVIDEN